MDIPHAATEWPWKLPVSRHGNLVAYTLVDRDIAEKYPHPGRVGWRFAAPGYARGHVDGQEVQLHRLVLGLRAGDGHMADHINRDKFDNRRENLRVVDAKGNSSNRPSIGSTSTHRGVSWAYLGEGAWTAFGQPRALGRYLSELVAAIVAERYRRENMPEATPSPVLAKYEHIVQNGILVCHHCGAETAAEAARYWKLDNGVAACQPCNGHIPARSLPRTFPPKPCANCGKPTKHLARGRCDTCYSFMRRNGFDRQTELA